MLVKRKEQESQPYLKPEIVSLRPEVVLVPESQGVSSLQIRVRETGHVPYVLV